MKLAIVILSTMGVMASIVFLGIWGIVSIEENAPQTKVIMAVPQITAAPHPAQELDPMVFISDTVATEGIVRQNDSETTQQSEKEIVEQPANTKEESDATRLLAVQIKEARERCFGAVPSFYESRPLPQHVREKGAVTYIDNQALVIFKEGVAGEKIQKIVQSFDGHIVGCVASLDLYQVQFDTVIPTDNDAVAFFAAIEAENSVKFARAYEVVETEE